MIRNNELNKIDYASGILINNCGVYEQNKQGIVSMALLKFLRDNYSNGFPVQNDARKIMETLNKNSIEKELLKNIVKKQSVSQKNGYATVLGVNKTYDKIYHMDEAEAVLYNLLNNQDISYVKDILKKYPIIYECLVSSFVSSRYFSNSFGMNTLDNEDNITPNDMVLIEKIESAYKNSLEYIDFAVNTTKNRLGPNFTIEELFKRLKKYILNGDASGFTRTNGARDCIKSLSQEEIIKELLKNVVKVGSLNKSQGYDTLFNDNINYDDPNMSLEKSEEIINNLILTNQNNLGVVLDTVSKHEVLFNGLISSFVNRRYYNPKYRALLDDPRQKDNYTKSLCDMINNYQSSDYNSGSAKM